MKFKKKLKKLKKIKKLKKLRKLRENFIYLEISVLNDLNDKEFNI